MCPHHFSAISLWMTGTDGCQTQKKKGIRARCGRTSFWQKRSSLMVGRSGIVASALKPKCERGPRVEDAKLTSWLQGKRMQGGVHEDRGAAGQLRRRRVTEKSMCWRTKPSGPQRQSSESCATESRRWKMSGRSQQSGEDTKPDEEYKMEVDGEADSRKKQGRSRSSCERLRRLRIWMRILLRVRGKSGSKSCCRLNKGEMICCQSMQKVSQKLRSLQDTKLQCQKMRATTD